MAGSILLDSRYKKLDSRVVSQHANRIQGELHEVNVDTHTGTSDDGACVATCEDGLESSRIQFSSYSYTHKLSTVHSAHVGEGNNNQDNYYWVLFIVKYM